MVVNGWCEIGCRIAKDAGSADEGAGEPGAGSSREENDDATTGHRRITRTAGSRPVTTVVTTKHFTPQAARTAMI